MSAACPIFRIQVRLPLDRFALEVDFSARERVTGLFGVSGAGKTTWVEVLAGLRRGAEGVVSFGEEVWLDSRRGVFCPPERRRIGYVPQEALLFPHLSVRGNLLAGRHGAPERAERLGEVVALLELGALLERSVERLSGGERQRVALGRALCAGPRLLLLDEPLASLDGALRRRILPFLARVREHFALPILMVSHNPLELQALCDEVVVLREGRVVTAGRPVEVFTRPEVFALVDRQGFANVLPGRVRSVAEHTATVALGTTGAGPELVVLRPTAEVGESVLLSVAASEILLADRRPVGLSARNALEATVERVDRVDHCLLVTTRLLPELPPLVVEITADAAAQLQILPGARLFLVIKSSSVAVHA